MLIELKEDGYTNMTRRTENSDVKKMDAKKDLLKDRSLDRQ